MCVGEIDLEISSGPLTSLNKSINLCVQIDRILGMTVLLEPPRTNKELGPNYVHLCNYFENLSPDEQHQNGLARTKRAEHLVFLNMGMRKQDSL